MAQNYIWKDLDLSKSIFVTMDVDWVCDEALLEVISLLQELDITVTVFATHNTPVLDNFRDAGFELGIHPNFNDSFKVGDSESALETVKKLQEYIPEAKSVRSHSLSSGSVLSTIFRDTGFRYESNVMIPYTSGINLMPYEAPKGLLQLPYNWGDYTYLQNTSVMDIAEYLNIKGLKIMNFHPIHLFLNTNNIELYNRAKAHTTEYSQLKNYVNKEGKGIRDFLSQLVDYANKNGFTFSKIRSIPTTD